MATKMRGANDIMRNLTREIGKIEGDISVGLKLAVKHVQAESQEATPVEFGVLNNSAFSDVQRVGRKIIGRVGYTAKYAPFVHEMPSSNNFTKQGTGPKFLENAVLRNTKVILDLIRKKAKR